MERRKQIIVDPKGQRRAVRRLALGPLILLAVAAQTTIALSSRVVDDATMAGVDLPTLRPLVLTMLAFLFSTGAMIVLLSRRYSHAIAGPAHKLRESIERVRSGDRAFRVALREGDELEPLAVELNQLLDWLDQPEQLGPGRDQPATDQASAPPPREPHAIQ